MKKLTVFLSVLFVFLFALTANAAETQTEPFANAGELYQSWNEQFPDYISGVWSTDGGTANLTFGIAESADFEESKNEILSLIKNDTGVTFVQQKYARNELMRIQEEMHKYFEDAATNGLCSMGLYDTQNCIQVEFLESKKEDENTKQLIASLQEQYGDAVRIAWSEGYAVLTYEETPAIQTDMRIDIDTRNTSYYAFFLAVACLLVMCFGGFLFVRKKQTAALQTVSGSVITSSPAVSKKEVEAAIKNAEIKPDSALDKRITDILK